MAVESEPQVEEERTESYNDPAAFFGDLEKSLEYQQAWSTFLESRPRHGDYSPEEKQELRDIFLDSDTYKEAIASFVEQDHRFSYQPQTFFARVENKEAANKFEQSLDQYFQISRDLRKAAHHPGEENRAYQLSVEKMKAHDDLGERLSKMGLSPSKAAGRQLVRLIAIDKGFDTEESLRGADIQRRKAREQWASTEAARL